jgi:hypothetical protein
MLAADSTAENRQAAVGTTGSLARRQAAAECAKSPSYPSSSDSYPCPQRPREAPGSGADPPERMPGAVQRARYITLETITPMSDDPSSACQPWQPNLPGPAGIVVALVKYTTPPGTTPPDESGARAGTGVPIHCPQFRVIGSTS